MNRLLVIVYIILFALGAAVIVLTPVSEGLPLLLLKFYSLGLLTGIVEAVASAYTGERRLVWSWLPPTAGFTIGLMTQLDYQDPDLRALWLIFIMIILGHNLLFAIVVHATAAGILWLRRSRIWPQRST
jgi:hypothetical protein